MVSYTRFSHANSKVVRSFLGPNVSSNCTDQVALSVVEYLNYFYFINRLIGELVSYSILTGFHSGWTFLRQIF